MKPRMKFMGRRGIYLVWQSREPITPNDSRYEEITCAAPWFYGQMVKREQAADPSLDRPRS